MIVAISYHPGDKPLMERWANHVKKLGPYLNHEIVLCPSHGASTDGIAFPLENCFRRVHLVTNGYPEKGWPVSCNRAFQTISWWAMQNKQPFLFMEPDAIPLQEGWIDQIEAEYRQAGAPFMGDFVKLTTVMDNGIDHMSGVAVYHWDLTRLAPRVFNCISIVKDKMGMEKEHEWAWDLFAASDIVPKMHQTNLIQHDWTGTGDKPHQWRKENVEKSFVRPGAIIYHPDKRGILMEDGLAGEATRAVGELRTGAPESDSSFEQVSPAPPSDKDPIQSLEKILLNANSSRSFKRAVKEKLIQHGWIKTPKKAKQPRKKVRADLGGEPWPRAY